MNILKKQLINPFALFLLTLLSVSPIAAEKSHAEDKKAAAEFDSFLLKKLETGGTTRVPLPMREPIDFSSPKNNTKVIMLGSGSPVPIIERFGPGAAVVVNDRPYLVDAGEGIWRASQAATPKYGGKIKGLDAKQLDRLFLTHHHADHTSGLASIIFLPWYLGADRQLDIYGPRHTAKIVNKIIEAYQYVLDVGEVTGTKYDAPIIAQGHDFIKSGMVYQDENVTVDAFKVLHGNMPNSFSYKFTTNDRVVVISGDKRFTPGFKEWAKGAELLLHEVYTLGGLENAPARVPLIVGDYHTSTKQLAEAANFIKPKLLVLYHVQNYTGDPNGPLDEMRAAGYNGELVIAVDQDIY